MSDEPENRMMGIVYVCIGPISAELQAVKFRVHRMDDPDDPFIVEGVNE